MRTEWVRLADMTAALVLLGLVAVAAITAVVVEAVRATPPPSPARRPDRLAHVEQATRSPAGPVNADAAALIAFPELRRLIDLRDAGWEF